MPAELRFVITSILPVLVGGLLHMIAIRLRLLQWLAIPIHERWFGRNKTWRGFVVTPLFTVPGVYLALAFERAIDNGAGLHLRTLPPVALGLALGFAYVLFELPNSFLKRRLGIPPGKLPEKNRLLFFILDHIDSLIGCTVVAIIFLKQVPLPLVLAIVTAPLLHIGVNFILHFVGIRKEVF
jgi:CDP-diacylglycerol--serine O-phosphatidyltransferase